MLARCAENFARSTGPAFLGAPHMLCHMRSICHMKSESTIVQLTYSQKKKTPTAPKCSYLFCRTSERHAPSAIRHKLSHVCQTVLSNYACQIPAHAQFDRHQCAFIPVCYPGDQFIICQAASSSKEVCAWRCTPLLPVRTLLVPTHVNTLSPCSVG